MLVDPDGVTPAKANFFNSWSYVDERRQDTFLYLAFDRQDSGGNVFLAFELNQDTRLVDERVRRRDPVPHEGDIIVSYEIQNDDNIDVVIQRGSRTPRSRAAEVAGGFTNGAGLLEDRALRWSFAVSRRRAGRDQHRHDDHELPPAHAAG